MGLRAAALRSLQAAMSAPRQDPAPSCSLPLYWRLLEVAFARIHGIRSLDDRSDCLFAYNLAVYRGPELLLPAGEGSAVALRGGETVLEIHFRREALLPLARSGDPLRMGLCLLKLGDREFPRLALAVEEDPRLRHVRALHAVTLLHRGISRYGFEVLPIRRPLLAWGLTVWQRLLMARDHTEGFARVRGNKEELVAREVWLSRERLLREWGRNGSKRRPPGSATREHAAP